jgi:hypothetical protein
VYLMVEPYVNFDTPVSHNTTTVHCKIPRYSMQSLKIPHYRVHILICISLKSIIFSKFSRYSRPLISMLLINVCLLQHLHSLFLAPSV